MNKWICLGGAALVAVGGIAGGASWYFVAEQPCVQGVREALVMTLSNLTPPAAPSDDSETSEVIEPLRVDGEEEIPLCRPEPVTEETRVVLKPGMQQPPRPDAEPGKTVRMPYAEEDESFLRLTLAPVLRILESTLPRLNLFEKEPAEQNPAEESEKSPEAPMEETPPTPEADYHHHPQHCPYMGGCPYPYPRR